MHADLTVPRELCVLYSARHIKTHTYNKANTLSAWSLSFSLTAALEDSSSQTIFCPLVFLILHCFLSAFISVIPVHLVRTKARKSRTCQWDWRILWLLFFYGYEKKLGITADQCLNSEIQTVFKKRKVVLSADIKKHITLTKHQHTQLMNLVHEENNESLYCSSEHHYSRPAGTVSLILCKITTIT